MSFEVKKRIVANIIKAILNVLAPLSKASLLGLILDLLPYLKLSQVKRGFNFTKTLSSQEVQSIGGNYYRELVKGNLFREWLNKYPLRNSWLTTLVCSTLLFQLWGPSEDQYPPTLSVEDHSELFQRHGITDIRLGLRDSHPGSTTSLSGLKRLEVEVVVKQTITSFLSALVGIWLLRSHNNKTSQLNFLFRSDRHIGVAIFSLVHASYTLWKFQKARTINLNKPWQLTTPWLNFNLNWLGKFSELIIFSWSSYEILSTWFYRPELLPPHLRSWVTTFFEVSKPQLDYTRALQSELVKEGTHSDILTEYCRNLGVSPELGDPAVGLPSCRLFHPQDGHSCHQASLRKFTRASLRALFTIYLPVTLLQLLMKLKAHPPSPVTTNDSTKFTRSSPSSPSHLLLSALRSSLFMGTLVASFSRIFCHSRLKLTTDRYSVPLSASLSSLIALPLESPSRRLYLTLLLFPRALTTFYHHQLRPYLPAHYLETPLLLLSLTTLLTCYRLQPTSLPPPLLHLLKWVFRKYP